MTVLLLGDAPSIHIRRWADALVRAGENVHVASFRSANLADGVPVHVLPTFGLGKAGYVLAAPALGRLVRRLRPSVVHAHYATSYGLLGALVGGAPLIITTWGSDTILAPRESRLLRRALRFALVRAEAVTSMAEHMNAQIHALGVRPERLHVLPLGVDLARFRDVGDAPRDEALLVCTRSFAPVYDVATFVRAVGRLRDSGRAVRAHLIGDGPLRPALERLVRELRLEPVVRFIGSVSHDALPKLLRGAGIYVTSSRSDGNSVSLGEAMAAGCIPVASDIPANAPWIANGLNGYLFPVGDAAALARALEAALDAPRAWRDAARSANLARIEQEADWRTTVECMRAIYDAVRVARPSNGNGVLPPAAMRLPNDL